MNIVNQYQSGRNKLSIYKLAGVIVLILLVAISSCGVKKGLQYLFSSQQTTSTNATKSGKSNLSLQSERVAWNQVCSKIQDIVGSTVSGMDAHNSASSNLALYFILLPAFLISLQLVYKDRIHLSVPRAVLNWRQLPLFIQNSIFLI
ncbi:hypothetical protein [Albibacterium bauzanense]|uniref:Uncharacterized protein n=1 Tax=Albibacterium bauzanense TaxID=653929 RepID=A0A4R1LW07_9SPHI|nr:hypothetical protein [Albibacterium bauzanense]TCK83626.1 hypothetical protein C8N28_2230 [Albibacterium bauzanense]